MPKKARFDAHAAKRLEKEFRNVDLEMYKLDLSLSHYFAEKDRIRAPYISLLKLVRNHFEAAKKEFSTRVE